MRQTPRCTDSYYTTDDGTHFLRDEQERAYNHQRWLDLVEELVRTGIPRSQAEPNAYWMINNRAAVLEILE